MIQDSIFDEVHDCQETFRLLLYAISNPGEIVGIGKYARNLEDEDKIMLLLALTLLDKETSFMVVGSNLLTKTAANLTYSKEREAYANFIFVAERCSPELMENIFSKTTPGTLVEPHTNSVLIIGVDQFDQSGSCLLKGPGINGCKRAALSGYARQWILLRDSIEYEYPTGIDLYFVTPQGELMAIPRKVSMEG